MCVSQSPCPAYGSALAGDDSELHYAHSMSPWIHLRFGRTFRIFELVHGGVQCAYNKLSERATTACIMPYRISNRIPHCTDNHAEIRELITTNHIKIKISHLVHALSRDGASGCLRASARASHKHDQFAISISFCQFIFVVFVVVTIGTLQEPLDWSGCCNCAHCALDNRIVFECKRSNVFVTILFDFFLFSLVFTHDSRIGVVVAGVTKSKRHICGYAVNAIVHINERILFRMSKN